MPESNTRLTEIQATVLAYAAKCAKQNQTRITLAQIDRHFEDHPQRTAIPEAIYELLDNGFLAEHRSKTGQVVAKNYTLTDAGKDQAAFEADQANTPSQRKSRARTTGKADAKDDPWDQTDAPPADKPAKSPTTTPAAKGPPKAAQARRGNTAHKKPKTTTKPAPAAASTTTDRAPQSEADER